MIVDDQRMVLEGLKVVINSFDGIEVITTASNGKEAYENMKIYTPDVILMDIQMPILNGVEAIKKIKAEYKVVKIIILTTFSDEEYIYEGIQNGANGYMLKDTSPEKIADGIRSVYEGGSLIEPQIATKLLNRFNEMASSNYIEGTGQDINLTVRELEIVHLIGEGYNNKEISDDLFISVGTVKNNITRILDKLELRDRTQLAIFAVKHNL